MLYNLRSDAYYRIKDLKICNTKDITRYCESLDLLYTILPDFLLIIQNLFRQISETKSKVSLKQFVLHFRTIKHIFIIVFLSCQYTYIIYSFQTITLDALVHNYMLSTKLNLGEYWSFAPSACTRRRRFTTVINGKCTLSFGYLTFRLSLSFCLRLYLLVLV